MDDADFEGTLVLERLAEIGGVEEFFDVVDADDFAAAEALMRTAGVDTDTIALVLKRMHDADGEH